VSDLKSWNVITIEGMQDELVVDELPDFNLVEGDGWENEGDLHSMSGWSSATPFAVGDWAKEFTAAHPGATVTWYEEFRMDDVGESSNVYRGGELITYESTVSQMVPLNLPNLLGEAKKILADYVAPDPAQSLSHHYSQIAPSLAAALENLVKGLS
jgi:hypothetical protein